MQIANNLPGTELVSETLRGGFCVDTISTPNPGFYIMEIWKDIKGWEGLYQVSNFGNVKSLEKATVRYRAKKISPITYKERIMKPVLNKITGYNQILLQHSGKKKLYFISRLVALAFIPNPENKPEVNHKNSIRNDNRVENLEWVTTKENSVHGFKSGFRNNEGENNPRSKLNEFQVRVIRKCDDLKGIDLAKIFNTVPSNISGIKKRKTWKKRNLLR